jgi:hypothetical protein
MPCSCIYSANFAGFCMCHTGLSGGAVGGEGMGLYYRTLTGRYDSAHTSLLLVAISHGCGQFYPQMLWTNLPTHMTHRLSKTAVNVRVKYVIHKFYMFM